ncbi:hypothetical protein A2690_00520 [Candidatus Roizmanbacteria bacterium RIFCSPHIGHO2_01_FULL_39_12b]|uniref:Fido domain-containing protein n=1 Tax=Candidatus Roizmanbacteria bacterium RIFCSPHIGHO2_01_FULL_39_12b TaxID=1802030 RepID=A0A1F7G8K1_9BACT|nr:MAG: hypothetical protein A2690_00520 [Candidatus Roizmanbacteria bacterium RIFCSPHIGHO2_01_FULL_39_12b]
MYQPFFEISPRISSALEAIGQILGFLKATRIPKAYEKEYLTKVIIDTINSSTAIEGNTLTPSQIKKVVKGKKIIAMQKDIQEVKNYHRAVKELIKITKTKDDISEKIILNLHKIITNKLDINRSGQYRKQMVIVGDYLSPKPNEVLRLMKEFVKWINKPTPTDLSPLLYAGIVHYRFVAIHPFADGNGRTARILTKLILMKFGYNITKLFSLETYYNRDRKAYYQALSTIDKYRIDRKENLTLWLEYFIEGMLVEAERARSKIIELQSKSKQVPILLTNSQQKALVWFTKNKILRMQDYIKISGLSRKGAYKSLNVLVKLRQIIKVGVGKQTYYVLLEK